VLKDEADYDKAVSKKIRLRRKKLKLTQKQLGEKANISQPWISHIENGLRKQPSYRMLRRLVLALDFSSLGEFFSLVDEALSMKSYEFAVDM
jgi:transcriptional regulator with XRE-family HTH domain